MSLRAIAGMLAERIEDLTAELVGTAPTSKGRREWRFRGKGSLAVVVNGDARGDFFDHEAGIGGDALGFVAHLRRCAALDAYRWALDWLSGHGSPTQPRRAARPATSPQRWEEARSKATLRLVQELWSEATDPAGTVVERYLQSRSLVLPTDAPLRFHPACPRGSERWPAMLALMTHPITNEPTGGVHRTFLQRDGSDKAPGQAKMMLGPAGVIRLVSDDQVTHGLGIAEGIETALSIMQVAGWTPVWACGCASAMRKFPVLAGVELLTILADADDDGVGIDAARTCAALWTASGREVRTWIPPHGHDWNDVARRAVA